MVGRLRAASNRLLRPGGPGSGAGGPAVTGYRLRSWRRNRPRGRVDGSSSSSPAAAPSCRRCWTPPAPAPGSTVVAVVADRADACGLDRAREAGRADRGRRARRLPGPRHLGRRRRARGARRSGRTWWSWPGSCASLGAPDAAPLRRADRQHPPRAAARLPRRARRPGRAGARRQGHRLLGDPRGRRHRHRADRRPAGGRRPRRRRRGRRCTSGSRWSSASCSSTSSAGCAATAGPSTTGRSPRMSSGLRRDGPTAEGRVPVRRALVSVYDKTGLEDLARGLHEAGVAIVSTGSTAARIAAAGVPVTPVEELTGFPECLDGRVKTLHPRGARRAARRPAAARARRAARGARHRAVRPAGRRTSTRSRRRSPSGASPDECVEQIDIGGPSMVRGRGEEPRERRRRRRPGALRRGAGRRPGRRVHPRPAAAAGGRGVRRTPRRYDVAVASWMGNVLVGPPTRAAASRPGSAPPGTKASVLRYGENPHQRAALYRTGGGGPRARRSSCTARRCRTTTTSTPTPPGAPRRTTRAPAVAIIKHNNPCGIAVGRPTIADRPHAHAGARLRPGLGVRRRGRREPAR